MTLREFRGGRTQAEMANIYAVSQQAWGKWEAGKAFPRHHIMKRIEEDSGVPMEEMFPDAFTQKGSSIKRKDEPISDDEANYSTPHGEWVLTQTNCLVNINNGCSIGTNQVSKDIFCVEMTLGKVFAVIGTYKTISSAVLAVRGLAEHCGAYLMPADK